jgi:Ni,Fe-hydrogenase I large subunit
MSTALDPESQSAINADSLAFIRQKFQEAKRFVEQVYIPDLLAVAPFYMEWFSLGEGLGNFLSYGDFPTSTGELFLPQGVILDRDLSTVHPVDQTQITEQIARSWYEYNEGEQAALHPWEGETVPNYTGPQPPFEFLETDQKYTWMKAPRYQDRAVEVGPLARMLVAYGAGHPGVVGAVNATLETLGAGPEALFSTLGRTAARGLETLVIAGQLEPWLDELAANMAEGNLNAHAGDRWDPSTWPAEAQGYGPHEAPRGALGHWVKIKDGKIENYQCVVPSTWNCSPRDSSGQPGAYEAALPGTPLAEPEQPLEILRTIHSFDPCMACGVHIVDAEGKELTRVELEGRM